MAPRTVNLLTNIEVDEISLVDRPANQHARVAIAKRAEEVAVPDNYYDGDGQVVDLDTLEVGSVVYDDTGAPFELSLEDDEAEIGTDDEPTAQVGKSLSEQVREDLSKAFSEVERDDVIAKAMDSISKAEKRAQDAEEIAKSERTLRLSREYVSKAAEYGVAGVTPEELGPVLMRMAESMPFEDCAVIHKALTSAGAAFAELGFTGGAAGANDPMAIVDGLIEGGDIAKSADSQGLTREAVIAKAFAENPEAYDQYLANRRG